MTALSLISSDLGMIERTFIFIFAYKYHFLTMTIEEKKVTCAFHFSSLEKLVAGVNDVTSEMGACSKPAEGEGRGVPKKLSDRDPMYPYAPKPHGWVTGTSI